MMQFWHNHITDRSFAFLQELRKRFRFVLIGGWAVYFYTKALKSKDIDLVVSLEELGKLRLEFPLLKNERLRKYEIKAEGFDIDVYVPYWSELGVPADFIIANTITRQGFVVPKVELLLILKLFAYRERKGSLKGKKDLIDIISLLLYGSFNPELFLALLKTHSLESLCEEVKEIFKNNYEIKELGMNRKKFADFKKDMRNKLL